jgi:hypothetical protein
VCCLLPSDRAIETQVLVNEMLCLIFGGVESWFVVIPLHRDVVRSLLVIQILLMNWVFSRKSAGQVVSFEVDVVFIAIFVIFVA